MKKMIKKERNNNMPTEVKNELLKMVTAIALAINVIGVYNFISKYFDTMPKFTVIWIISLIWIIVFIIANVFRKPKRK